MQLCAVHQKLRHMAVTYSSNGLIVLFHNSIITIAIALVGYCVDFTCSGFLKIQWRKVLTMKTLHI